MVEGKLVDKGRESRNVQVVLCGSTPQSAFALQDEERELLIVEAEGDSGRTGG